MNEPALFSSAEFNAHLAQGKLMGSRNRATGAVYVPPRPLAPDTTASGMEWVEMSGRGTLAAFTVVYIAPTAMLAAGYDRQHPYCAGIVKLEEGPSISAQILDVDVQHPETIQIGTPLQVAFVPRGEGDAAKTVLAFRPAVA